MSSLASPLVGPNRPLGALFNETWGIAAACQERVWRVLASRKSLAKLRAVPAFVGASLEEPGKEEASREALLHLPCFLREPAARCLSEPV